MKEIDELHSIVKNKYDKGLSDIGGLRLVAEISLEKLGTTGICDYFHERKKYNVFGVPGYLSRPILSDYFILDRRGFRILWEKFISSINRETHTSSMDAVEVDRVVYTAIMSFAACYDIWKNKSRKTPGTHFELLLGSLLSLFAPHLVRSKFISLPNQDEKVATDIVFSSQKGGLVIPAKITTRERIVQPYAHQRILDSIFPDLRYKSVLLCVSETQRDDVRTRVNDICVPGTIKLFQTHLARLSAIYYLDPPDRYLDSDMTKIIQVSRLSQLFCKDLPALLPKA